MYWSIEDSSDDAVLLLYELSGAAASTLTSERVETAEAMMRRSSRAGT